MGEFKDISQYKNFLQDMTEKHFGNREKISKREFFSIFQGQISKFNSQGLKNLDTIFATDGDPVTVTKEEMMTAFSLMDLNLSNKKPDGELNAESSILNLAEGAEFEEARDSVLNALKSKADPIAINEQEALPFPNPIFNDSTKIAFKPMNTAQFNPNDFTLEALRERFKEPEYKIIEEESIIIGLPPSICIEKDGKEIGCVINDGAGEIGTIASNYDEYGNLVSKQYAINGKVITTEENKYSYDEKGNIKFELYYVNSELSHGSYYEYDEYNNVTLKISLDENKKPITTTEKTYDNHEIYYVKDEKGEEIEVSVHEIYDTQAEVDKIRSLGGSAYLRDEVTRVSNYPIELSEVVRDANGNIIEKFDGEKHHSPLADEINFAISAKTSFGLPTTDLTALKTAMEKIHPSNIDTVLSWYKNTYGTDLLSDIKKEWGARITKEEEMDEILNKLKSTIAKSASQAQLQHYFQEALSGTPDIQFIEDIIKSKNFHDYYFKEQTGKSLIQNLMDKNLTISLDKRKELIGYIIDKRLGGPGDYTVSLKYDLEAIKKAAYEELDRQVNKFGTMDATKLEQILGSQPFNTNYKDPNMPNGKIDKTFSQSYNGDCWLISAIMAISLTKNADKYFSDILTITDLGNIEVKLKGSKSPYVITKEDILIGSFLNSANGDGDVKAIERAFEKHRIESGCNNHNALDGGTIYDAFLQLLGEDKFKCYEINNLSNDFIKENFGAENNATIIGRGKKEHEINVAYKPDGSEIELTTEHAWAISRNDDKYVYIIDPNVGTEEWHIAIEDFKKAFDSCAVATLD